MMSMEVGIRELRADLSRWLRRVQAGEDILVTDRGRPVARITAANGRSKLEELIAAGVVTPAKRRPSARTRPKPISGAGPVSDLLLEDRR
jgi:prevent-host-death family protein